MVNQKEALKRLNKEKDYEDKIADDLLNYYIASLDDISDITPSQKKKAKEVFNTIARESLGHSNLFSMLINYVLNNGETNY